MNRSLAIASVVVATVAVAIGLHFVAASLQPHALGFDLRIPAAIVSGAFGAAAGIAIERYTRQP